MTAVLPPASKISFMFNNTRAHAIEWRVENEFVRKAYTQSATDTYEAPDGSVLFGYAENSISMVYQLTKIVSLTEPARCVFKTRRLMRVNLFALNSLTLSRLLLLCDSLAVQRRIHGIFHERIVHGASRRQQLLPVESHRRRVHGAAAGRRARCQA